MLLPYQCSAIIYIYSQYVVVSTCIKCVPFAYMCVCLRQANKFTIQEKRSRIKKMRE